MRSQIENRKTKIVIAGAGPAGSSLAIRLAQLGFETTLIERERFPRQKLCGEFISPECLHHFAQLGVRDGMLDAGGDRILETRFFQTGGRSVAVPTGWFGQGEFAISLSRAEMDNRLLKRAKDVGVLVHEATTVTSVVSTNGRVDAVTVRGVNTETSEIMADIFVDATGRSRILAKLAEKKVDVSSPSIKPQIVGFKAHLKNVDLSSGLCEIYSFPSGYAGVSHVENGLFNLCFLIKAETVRSTSRNADELMRRVVMKNKRAAETLQRATAAGDWLAVSIDGFGAKKTAAATNLFTVGDAAAFIDPFTGSGMVMAFESAQILAEAIVPNATDCAKIANEYHTAYDERFAKRLQVCSLLRRAAFMPNLATVVVSLLSVSTAARRRLAQGTRGSVSDQI